MEFPQIDPVAIAIGPLQVHWYGLMYMIGFAAAWLLGVYRAKQPNSGWTKDQVGDLVFYGAMGVILGGRLGYVLFYNFGKFLDDPLWLFAIWTGGMSFHGGALGVLDAQSACLIQHSRVVYELGHGLHAQLLRKLHNAAAQGERGGVAVELADQAAVDLDQVYIQAQQVLKVGVTGAKIINGNVYIKRIKAF